MLPQSLWLKGCSSLSLRKFHHPPGSFLRKKIGSFWMCPGFSTIHFIRKSIIFPSCETNQKSRGEKKKSDSREFETFTNPTTQKHQQKTSVSAMTPWFVWSFSHEKCPLLTLRDHQTRQCTQRVCASLIKEMMLELGFGSEPLIFCSEKKTIGAHEFPILSPNGENVPFQVRRQQDSPANKSSCDENLE